MIRLRFKDPDIEHSPEVVAWLRECERKLNEALPGAALIRLRDDMLIYGIGPLLMNQSDETYGMGPDDHT